MKAVIMAGGLGTRIASVANNIPKSMIRINGKPVLQYQIENLRSNGIKDITIVVGHLGDVIKNYFCDGSSFGVNIKYFTEDIPHGTAGALFYMASLDEDFLLILGDILFDVDFSRFIHYHRSSNALATVMAHPNAHNFDCSMLVTRYRGFRSKEYNPIDTHVIKSWLSTDDQRGELRNLVNCGVHIIKPELLGMAKKSFVPLRKDNPKFVDLDRNILKPFVKTKRIIAYDTCEYLKDMGTPERLYECERDIQNGMFLGRSYSRIKKAVFFNREEVIAERDGALKKGATEALKIINSTQYLAIAVSCKSGSFESLSAIDCRIDTALSKKHAFIDGIYYKPFFMEQASLDMNIDLTKSIYIGKRPEMLSEAEKECTFIDIENEDGFLDYIKKYLVCGK